MSIRIQRASSKRYLEFEAAGVLVRDGFDLNERGVECTKWRLADETPELLRNADWLWFRSRMPNAAERHRASGAEACYYTIEHQSSDTVTVTGCE